MEGAKLTEEISFSAILQSSLTDTPIILEGTIKGYHVIETGLDVNLKALQEGANTSSSRFITGQGPGTNEASPIDTGMRSLRAVGSTIHSMIKFPTTKGVATIKTSKEALWECRQIERMHSSWKEAQWCQHKEQMSRIREQPILRAMSIPNRKAGKEPMITEET
ncbi:hypothetical protein Tco_1354030 [Tanacetum coccineum]